jgi:hypothetical protein
MNAVTTITNRKGDIEAHVAGCQHLTQTNRVRTDSATTIEGATILEAVRNTDADWADAFGYDYPVAEENSGEVWSIEFGSIATAPCLTAAMKAERKALVADAMPKLVVKGHDKSGIPAEPVKISWWAIPQSGERMPRQDSMRGTWGWDASCSCGWDSRTGGAVFRCVRQMVNEHKLVEHGIASKPRGPKARRLKTVEQALADGITVTMPDGQSHTVRSCPVTGCSFVGKSNKSMSAHQSKKGHYSDEYVASRA